MMILKYVLKSPSSKIIINGFEFLKFGLPEFGVGNLHYLRDIFPILEGIMLKGNNKIVEEGL